MSESKSYRNYLQDADNELELTYTSLFIFYKKFISSQDGSTCSFHPSCSEYGVAALKRYGPVKGLTIFFDRYSRCNSLSPEYYQFDPIKRRLIDELDEF
jgi:putative membrane protein insertion efficiency factor